MRVNGAFLSITETSGVELENVELLLTEQGLFMFKAYSSGHVFDTSEVWIACILKLLQSNLIPTVIVPHNHPTPRVYEALLRRYPHTRAQDGGELTFRGDFNSEWKSYLGKFDLCTIETFSCFFLFFLLKKNSKMNLENNLRCRLCTKNSR
jgi:hypothetical protein